ncbi:hypothetical protein CDD80_7506 [Ophiocordyceps camponoti-rufipedis]|uniref:Fumarylacetoacetase-like C-terminal domain-containing protein n=1 Tax=Ophiocordyceps camponoti-rufipedis TaxID=2004952 RepID=A0A2C5Z813_9HYPO|nr:hypothetical protein CDD80_7506 [Ophiocordyceps camponoti-rufipedis]
MPAFSRLIRFLGRDNRIYHGDALLPPGIDDMAAATKARIIDGDVFGRHSVRAQTVDIRRLLSPLAPSQVATVRCLGLNYADHARETGMPRPELPVLFYKPSTALAGPADPIPVHAVAQEPDGLDYECELVVVIGKRCTDVAEEDALNSVLGYAVGNDVSHRHWQLRLGGGQWSLGKGFDGWAPFGPAIVTTDLIPDPQQLKIWTKVNGETLQDGSTADMIFDVKKTISFLSRGVTLMPGDLIFTGTPAGVGFSRSPPLHLKDGDVVQVGLERVGTCTNKVEFSTTKHKL